jgi:hypothetical protein
MIGWGTTRVAVWTNPDERQRLRVIELSCRTMLLSYHAVLCSLSVFQYFHVSRLHHWNDTDQVVLGMAEVDARQREDDDTTHAGAAIRGQNRLYVCVTLARGVWHVVLAILHFLYGLGIQRSYYHRYRNN